MLERFLRQMLAREKLLEIEHKLNPLHVGVRLMNKGISEYWTKIIVRAYAYIYESRLCFTKGPILWKRQF